MKRLECLDGLRGVLAVYVVISHMAPFAALPAWLALALSHGGAAVDVFFMLSGLVILRSLEGCRFEARRFLISRVARIFPVFLVMLAVACAVQALPVDFGAMPWIDPGGLARDIWPRGWPAAWAIEFGAHVTMVHGMFPNAVLPDVWVSFLGPAWSLSTEWQFYVLALVLGRSRMGASRLAAMFLGLAAAGWFWDSLAPEAWRFSRAFLPNKAHYFALGIASAAWVERRSMGSFLAALTATMMVCTGRGGVEKLLPPLVWTLCVAGQLYPGWLGTIVSPLRWRAVQWLGLVSYPLYLANEPVQKVVCVVLGYFTGGNPVAFNAVWVPAAVLLPIAVAALLHRYVEAPALRWGRALAIRGSRYGLTTMGTVH